MGFAVHLRQGARTLPAVAAALLLAAPPAPAATVTYAFEATVTTLTADEGVFGPTGTVLVGDTIHGSVTYEVGSANPDLAPENAQQGLYDLLAFEIEGADVAFAPFSIVVTHAPGTPTLPPLPPDLGTDGISFAATAPGYSIVRLTLETIHGGAFADDSLPTSLSLDDFPSSTGCRVSSRWGSRRTRTSRTSPW